MRAADDMVPNAGQVADTTPADEHDRVFLEVVPLATDVGRDFLAIGQPNPRDLSEGRVWLFRRNSPHLEANAPFLGARIQIAHLTLGLGCPSGLSNELINRRHKKEISEIANRPLYAHFAL